MRRLALAAALVAICGGAAFAQTPSNELKPAGEETSRADCLANFRAADRNGDGSLSPSEAEHAKRVIPTSLALSGPISFQDFMDACTAEIPRGG